MRRIILHLIIVSAQNISKSFQGVSVLKNVSLEVKEGEILCLIGPSGSGKSTLLKMINGLESPDSGELIVYGKLMDSQNKIDLRRKIGFVLQSPALFPHYTVAENIALVPTLLNWDRKRIEARSRELCDLIRLPFETYSKRYPSELSGGQQQRVGIARALAADPGLVLYDEPFSALDALTRYELQEEVLNLKQKLKKTSLFVTHDVREAFKLGDRIAILHEGEILQTGTPEELTQHPKTEFVEKFIHEGREG